jgi:hypothetical protein
MVIPPLFCEILLILPEKSGKIQGGQRAQKTCKNRQKGVG